MVDFTKAFRKKKEPEESASLENFYESQIKPKLDGKQQEALDAAIKAINENLTDEQQETLVNSFVELVGSFAVSKLKIF